jgi:hypothetical protein
MNKRKKVAWAKHRARAKRLRDRAKAEKPTGGSTSSRSSAGTAAAAASTTSQG